VLYTFAVDGKEELIEEVRVGPHGLTFLNALKEVASGHPDFVPEENYLTRIKICQACPKRVKSVNVCGVCKCIIPLKARFTRSSCPEGRW
jgi:hypothetical protein